MKTQNDIKKSQCDAILQADKISDRNISRFSEAARRISVEDNFQKKIPEMGNLYVRKAIDEMHQVLNLYFEKSRLIHLKILLILLNLLGKLVQLLLMKKLKWIIPCLSKIIKISYRRLETRWKI